MIMFVIVFINWKIEIITKAELCNFLQHYYKFLEKKLHQKYNIKYWNLMYN